MLPTITFISIFVHTPDYLSNYPSYLTYLTYPSIYLSIYPSYLTYIKYLSYLSYLSIHPIYISYLSADCEKKQAILEARNASLSAEESTILSRQAALKKTLYARFGDSINLEN